MTKPLALLALLVAAPLWAACGGDDDDESSATPTTTTTAVEEDLDAAEVGELVGESVKFTTPVEYLDPNGNGGKLRSSAIAGIGRENVVIEEFASAYYRNQEAGIAEEREQASVAGCGVFLVSVGQVSPEGGIVTNSTAKHAAEIQKALDAELGPC